eukprot:scaffold74706_cov48-Phaeocystis_antarctica.AAC.2
MDRVSRVRRVRRVSRVSRVSRGLLRLAARRALLARGNHVPAPLGGEARPLGGGLVDVQQRLGQGYRVRVEARVSTAAPAAAGAHERPWLLYGYTCYGYTHNGYTHYRGACCGRYLSIPLASATPVAPPRPPPCMCMPRS